jgi:hypothetical protein
MPYSGKLRWRGTLEAFLRSCFKASCSGILVEGHARLRGLELRQNSHATTAGSTMAIGENRILRSVQTPASGLEAYV